MEITSFIVVYIMVWWLLFFMALPFGIQRERNPIPGQDHGAPVNPKLKIKALIVTVLAFIVTFLVQWLIDQGFLFIK